MVGLVFNHQLFNKIEVSSLKNLNSRDSSWKRGVDNRPHWLL